MSYDVVLAPTFAQAETFSKQHADARESGLFGQAVTTFDAWIADLWELHGDGRALVGAMQRHVVMQQVLAACAGLDAPGVVPLAASCMRKAAGHPAFERALADVRAKSAPAGLAPQEVLFLEALARYADTVEQLGLIEPGVAAMALACRADSVFPCPLDVLIVEAAPLPWVQQAFFDACPQLAVAVAHADGAGGITPAPNGVDVRFAFPAGKLAEPGLVADIVVECAGQGDVVVVCKDPLDMCARVQDRLASQGMKVLVQARKPFAQTDFGRAYLAMYRCLHDEPWDPASLSDVVCSPFSGFSQSDAFKVDASLRADRIARRDDALATLRAVSEPFSQLEELACDPDADVLIGAFEHLAQALAHRSGAWRAEQLAAMGSLRDAMEAARRAGAGIEACASALERATVPVGAVVGALGPKVLFTTQELGARLGSGAVASLIAADLTSADYPIADKDDAGATLLHKLGLPPEESALSRARRQFSALCRVPSRALVMMRPLGDADADDTYPSVVLEEFVDAYRPDVSATDDIDNAYRVPAALLEGLAERGEELLYANARAACGQARQAVAEEGRRPSIAEVGRDAALVLPQRHDGTGRVLGRPCPSPSQVEAYLECPFLWFATRRLRIDVLDEGFGPLERGTFAHAALETFYRRFQEAGHAKVNAQNIGAARELMRSVAGQLAQAQFCEEPRSGRLVYATELERREVEALCDQLVAFLDYEARLLPGFRPAYLEFEIDADHPVEYAGSSLVGKVDRIDVDDRGWAVIIDYKGSVGAEHEIAGKTAGHAGKVQTRIYAQAVKRALGLNVVGALYVSYGRRPAVAGAYDPRAIDAAHLPGMKPDKCACGTAEALPADAADEFPFADLAFPVMLDETERMVASAVARMCAGDVEPAPASQRSCAYCPVLSCPKRGA